MKLVLQAQALTAQASKLQEMNEPIVSRRGRGGSRGGVLGGTRYQPMWLQSMGPLYVLTFLRALAFAVAALPACSLRVHELAVAAGGGTASAALYFGAISAFRHLAEFVGTQLLPAWSEKVGCQPVLLVSSAAFVAESALMSLASSPLLLGAAHVAGGLLFSGGAVESSCIADVIRDEDRCASAHGRLFLAFGTALVLGPALGGTLAARFGGAAPFACAHFLGLVSVAGVVALLPDYAPETRRSMVRRVSFASDAEPLPATVSQEQVERPLRSLLRSKPSLRWAVCAMVLSGLGMAMFAAVSVLWLQAALGWDGEEVGLFLSFGSCLQLVSQVVVLPCLFKITRWREIRVAKICLIANAFKFMALCSVQDSRRVFAILVAAAPGFCGTPVLFSLCTHQVPKADKRRWHFALTALNTVATVLGALAGSHLLVLGLQGSRPLGTPLFFAAACYFLAGACLEQASTECRANDKAKAKRCGFAAQATAASSVGRAAPVVVACRAG